MGNLTCVREINSSYKILVSNAEVIASLMGVTSCLSLSIETCQKDTLKMSVDTEGWFWRVRGKKHGTCSILCTRLEKGESITVAPSICGSSV